MKDIKEPYNDLMRMIFNHYNESKYFRVTTDEEKLLFEARAQATGNEAVAVQATLVLLQKSIVFAEGSNCCDDYMFNGRLLAS